MKKLILRFMLSAVMLTAFLHASAAHFYVDDIAYDITVDGRECEVVGCSNKITDLVIPAEVVYEDCKLSVTSIGKMAFVENTSLKSVDIPNSVTTIRDVAFYGCSSLASISIPNSLTSIEMGAFYECTSLASIDIPDSVTTIGEAAFYGCSSLASISIPNSVTSIGMGAFYGCSSLASVNIPDSVTAIENDTFRGCSSLASVNIPNSVTVIGERAFEICTSLTSIDIPDSVTSIGHFAFDGCKALVSVYIPDSVTSIGILAFCGCKALTTVNIPNSVTIIYNGTFANCSSLASIDIPNSVTEIRYQAFFGCSSLKTVEIPNSVTTIGAFAFIYCKSLESIKLSNRLKELVDATFEGCSNLSSISIPGSVNTIFQSGIWENPNEEGEIVDTEFYLFGGCKKLNTLILEYSPDALISGHHKAGYIPEITEWENWTENIEYATFDRQMEFDMPLPKLKALVLGEHLDKVQVKNISECDKLESIDCLSLMPPAAGEFSEAQYSNVLLRVPDDALDAYKQHKVWGKFLNLSGGIISGESNVAISPAQRKETGRYDLYGHSVSEDYQGLVIIRYSDGSSDKVFVR